MIKKAFQLFSLLFLIPGLSLAQTSDFTISFVFNDDSIPPSTPILLEVVPVAPVQIDIDWSASTDNYSVSGYVVLRDSVAVATTTLTSYMDTGLTPETLYSYEVYAFDGSGNFSTTSNALATTTLAVPIVVAPTSTPPTPPSGTQLVQLKSFNVVPSLNSSVFFWQTNIATKFALRWGRTVSYDEGYIVNDIYRSENQTLITDLEPGTTYLYELIGYTPSGIALSLKKGEFKTQSSEVANTPNVKNLQAVVIKSDVNLAWQTPIVGKDFTYRIVRSHLGYPIDPYDGAVVYEGESTSFNDVGALGISSPLYYTVFATGSDGTVSSGAVVTVYKEDLPSTEVGQVPEVSTEIEEVLPEPNVEIEIPDFGFSVENIKLRQGNHTFDFTTEDISLYIDEPFVVSIPYSSLPENLKSIVVTILDPANYKRSYSFLLRINKDRTAYESTIAPLKVEGFTRLQVEIFDYERQIIGRYSKQLKLVLPEHVTTEVVFPDKIVKLFQPLLKTTSLLILLLLGILFFLYIRYKKAEDNI